MSHPIVILNLNERVTDTLVFAQSVASALTGNPFLPSPTPPLAAFEADISALAAAQAAVLTRLKGAAEERDAKLAAVLMDLRHLRSYVQRVADANPASAGAIIAGAGMSVKKIGAHLRGELSVEQGRVSGFVHLVAKAIRSRAFYDWQYGTDSKTWQDAPSTLKAKTDIGGLAVATRYSFRVRRVTQIGPGDWTDPVSLVVG